MTNSMKRRYIECLLTLGVPQKDVYRRCSQEECDKMVGRPADYYDNLPDNRVYATKETNESIEYEAWEILVPLPTMDEFIKVKNACNILTIKKWVKFFGILSVIGLALGIVAGLILLLV